MSPDSEPPWVDDPVAEVEFDCLGDDGSTVKVSIVVHRPRQKAADDPYACAVESRGLTFTGQLSPNTDSKNNVYGVDSWQALSLAIQFANSGLVLASKKGVTFRWDGEELDMHELFSWNTAALRAAREASEKP